MAVPPQKSRLERRLRLTEIIIRLTIFFFQIPKNPSAEEVRSKKDHHLVSQSLNLNQKMAGPSWLVDSQRIATKIKSAFEISDPKRVNWKSNPTRACPNCDHIIDNSDVSQEWPGLPRGVKFDPSDQEIIWHLLSKVGVGNVKPHPFIEEFIPTVDEDDGICYTHPQNLPGVKQDGSVSHFFHKAIKAYSTGTRKRRKIHGDDLGYVRWHKTGRTKPVIMDGIQRGCKKIMVLYMSMAKGGKPEKTNWVMHQYHLGIGEDEKDGEFVVSKVFHQQQAKSGDKVEQDLPNDVSEAIVTKVDPVTPIPVIRDPPRTEREHSDIDHEQEPAVCLIDSVQNPVDKGLEGVPAEWEDLSDNNIQTTEDQEHHMVEDPDPQTGEDIKWSEGLSQYLLDSQQLVEELSLCDELLRSQSPNRDGDGKERKMRPCLSDYAHIGAEIFKEDLEECQNLAPIDPLNGGAQGECRPYHSDCAHVDAEDLKQDLVECQSMGQFDPSNIELDTPPDFRISQLFGSQDSFLASFGV